MKKIIQISQIIAVILFYSSSYSQVTVSFQSLQYTNNGQPTITPTNCGNIDLVSSTSTSINFGINLSKPNGQVVGISDLYVFTQKSPTDRVQRSWTQVQESFWIHPSSGNDTYSSSASFSINSSDFNVSGGTLYIVFKSSSGIEYQTACNYTITKTQLPVFNLSPTSTMIGCGSTSPITFSVANVYNSTGTLSYNWSIGSGWSGTVSSSMSSITLIPSSSTLLPSSIQVTPILNGVA